MSLRNDTVKKLRSLGREIDFSREHGRPNVDLLAERVSKLIDILIEDAGLSARGYADDTSMEENDE